MPKVAIIIPTFNAARNIGPILEDIKDLTYKNIEVILVDNASQDRTCKIARQAYPTIKLIKNKENRNYTFANNQGIEKALELSCDYLLFLNDDTEITSNLIEELLTPMLRNKWIGATGCVITYYDKPNIIWFAGGFLHKWFGYTTHPNMNRLITDVQLQNKQVDFITAVCLLTSWEMINKVGNFDDKYKIFFDEVAWCYCLSQLGYTNWLVAKPLVKHKVSSTTGVKGTNRLTAFRAFYYGRNPFFLIKDEFKGWHQLTCFIGQFIIRLPFYAVQVIRVGDWRSLREYLRGMRAGISYYIS